MNKPAVVQNVVSRYKKAVEELHEQDLSGVHQQEQQADWQMTIRDPEGDEPIHIGPGGQQGGVQQVKEQDVHGVHDQSQQGAITRPTPMQQQQQGAQVPPPAFGGQQQVAVAPPGWEETVKHMKKYVKDAEDQGDQQGGQGEMDETAQRKKKRIENPWALAWWMKEKGYEPHYASNPKVFLAAADEFNRILASDFWMTPKDVAEVCPPCARKMATLNIRKVRASVLFGKDILKFAAETTDDKQAKRWETMPTGWTDESRKKFWESVGGSVTKCMEKIKGHVDDPGAFCAALKDRIKGTTGWRGPE